MGLTLITIEVYSNKKMCSTMQNHGVGFLEKFADGAGKKTNFLLY